MRVLIFGINYLPDLTGIGKYTGEMGSWFAKNGDVVNVITAMPYYPKWKVDRKYKGKWWHKEIIEGARVYRCPLYVPSKVTAIRRVLHEMSFILSSIPVWISLIFKKKHDVIICVAPPFHIGFLPLLYTKLRGGRLVMHVQDLQVDVARELGMIRNSRFLDWMFGIEKFLMMKCTVVSTISKGLEKKIRLKGVAKSNCLIIPNWVDENLIQPLPLEKSLRQYFGFSCNDKVILYSGNLGEKQGLENIVEAAKEFTGDERVKFVIVGNGGTEHSLKEAVLKAGLKNIHFHPLIELEQLPALLAMADLHLVLQKKHAADLVMPSKLTSILSAGGCPLVTASAGSNLYELISDNNLGILVEPDCVPSLCEGIRQALSNDVQQMRINARNYAEEYLSKKFILDKWTMQLAAISSPQTNMVTNPPLSVEEKNIA